MGQINSSGSGGGEGFGWKDGRVGVKKVGSGGAEWFGKSFSNSGDGRVLDEEVGLSGTEEFKKSNLKSIKIPFIKEVLNFSGVELVLISENFLTVKKEKNVSWDSLKPMIISHLNDYFEKTEDPILIDHRKEKKSDESRDIINEYICRIDDNKVQNYIIEDIDRVKPYDITMPSTEVH